MAKFLTLDGLSTLVKKIYDKFIQRPTSAKFTDIASGVSMYYYRSSASVAAEFRMGICNESSNSTHYTYVYLSKYQARLYCQNSYIGITSSGTIYINIKGTSYSLNAAKAKELGVLS